MFLVPSLELGIDDAIALAVVHYRDILGPYDLLIASPYLFKILATCHNVNFCLRRQRYTLNILCPKKQLSAYTFINTTNLEKALLKLLISTYRASSVRGREAGDVPVKEVEEGGVQPPTGVFGGLLPQVAVDAQIVDDVLRLTGLYSVKDTLAGTDLCGQLGGRDAHVTADRAQECSKLLEA